MLWKGLQVDSLYDISVNKFETVAASPRTKDYIDLYFILNDKNWTIDQLRKAAGSKFGIYTETLQLAKQFLKAKEFTDFPKMLVPFDEKKMIKFFLNEAKSLESEIFK